MGIVTILLFGLGLSADAFAVSLCEGLKLKQKDWMHALRCGLFFGVFQMLMPILGFYIGDLMVRIPLIEPAVDWIAFGLLFFVAVKMLWDTLADKPGKNAGGSAARHGELLMLAVATSIDAMTVGISFAAKDLNLLTGVPKDVNVLLASGVIGVTTFLLSVLGVRIGCRVGGRFGKKAELAGGVILLLLAVKMLLDNLGVNLGF